MQHLRVLPLQQQQLVHGLPRVDDGADCSEPLSTAQCEEEVRRTPQHAAEQRAPRGGGRRSGRRRRRRGARGASRLLLLQGVLLLLLHGPRDALYVEEQSVHAVALLLHGGDAVGCVDEYAVSDAHQLPQLLPLRLRRRTVRALHRSQRRYGRRLPVAHLLGSQRSGWERRGRRGGGGGRGGGHRRGGGRAGWGCGQRGSSTPTPGVRRRSMCVSVSARSGRRGRYGARGEGSGGCGARREGGHRARHRRGGGGHQRSHTEGSGSCNTLKHCTAVGAQSSDDEQREGHWIEKGEKKGKEGGRGKMDEEKVPSARISRLS